MRSSIAPSASSRLRVLDRRVEILRASGAESMVIAFIATPSLKGCGYLRSPRVNRGMPDDDAKPRLRDLNRPVDTLSSHARPPGTRLGMALSRRATCCRTPARPVRPAELL